MAVGLRYGNDGSISVNQSANEYYKQPLFYSMGHFSKFLLPDSDRLDFAVDPKVANIETTVFVRPDNSTVLIALNTNDEPVLLSVVDQLNGNFTDLINARSLQSYIWFN